VWWRRAVLPSLPWVGVLFLFFGGSGSCPIAWDHAQWQADVVIINGGTNDHVYGPPTTERFTARYTELLQVVRSSQPDALIFAVVPLICSCQSSAGWLKGAIEQAVAEAGDARVSVVQTGSLSAPWLYCRDDYSDWTHPNVAGHTKFAERLLASVTETVRQAFPSKCGGSGSVCIPAGAGAAVPPPVPAPTPVLPVTWRSDKLIATHYWDCSGQGCDASTLSPWDATKYWSPAGYAPQDPNDHGGPSAYGEKLWVTGAASDRLSELLGPDDGCCGASGQGGCGQCVLLENPDSIQPTWRVIAMKKNRCPPAACGTTDAHFDIAAPGFDSGASRIPAGCRRGRTGREGGSTNRSAGTPTTHPSLSESGTSITTIRARRETQGARSCQSRTSAGAASLASGAGPRARRTTSWNRSATSQIGGADRRLSWPERAPYLAGAVLKRRWPSSLTSESVESPTDALVPLSCRPRGQGRRMHAPPESASSASAACTPGSD